MKLYTNINNCDFIIEVATSIEATKIGKTNKSKLIVRMMDNNDNVFNSIADKCDRGINQKINRKMKRHQKYMGA